MLDDHVGRERLSVRHFYDSLAATYDLYYPDWEADARRQGQVLYDLICAVLGSSPTRLLDCACGIGTQILGVASIGAHVVGTDFSVEAVKRARNETRFRGHEIGLAGADMRALPFRNDVFDGIVCADNAVPHLLTQADLVQGLSEMRRVLEPDGIVVITIRDYETARVRRPVSTQPSVRSTPGGRVITFQLWHWHDDGELYDMEHFQLLPTTADTWNIRRRVTTYRALGRRQLQEGLGAARFGDVRWHEPSATGYFQPIVTARAT